MTSPRPAGRPADTGPGPMPEAPVTSVRSPADPVAAAPPARDIDALAEPVAAAVLACPSVAGLSPGPYGSVGTYLPGRRITGVRITDDQVTVRVVARMRPLRTVEAEVRAAVGALVPGLPVNLGVDDVVRPDAPL